MALKALTAAIYARVQQHLLPPGMPWRKDSGGVITKVLLATGDELARVSQRGVDLITEADPRTTDELLEDFETALDLSGDPVDVRWIDGVNVTADGNTLEKTSGAGAYDAGAISASHISGDGHVDFTTGASGNLITCGLSVGDTDQGRADIDYGIQCNQATDIQVFEFGSSKTTLAVAFEPLVDIARIQRVGTEITYWHFDASLGTWTKLYTSLVASTGDLLVDSALWVVGDKIVDAVIQSTQARIDRVVARTIQHQRARPIDFQEALASILGQTAANVVVLETSRATAITVGDDTEIYRFFVYRDPTDPGTYDIVSAQAEINRIAHSHTKGHAIESISLLCDNQYSLTDRDLFGV